MIRRRVSRNIDELFAQWRGFRLAGRHDHRAIAAMKNTMLLGDGIVVGRIFKANAAPVRSRPMWTLAFGHHAIACQPTAMRHRETAMTTFAKSWRRE